MKKNLVKLLGVLLCCSSVKAQYCMLTGQTPYAPVQPGITHFSLNTINRTSGNSESATSVVVITGLSTTVVAGQTYSISITHSEDSQNFPGARNNLRVWIDYNKNFSFTDAGETVLLQDYENPGTTFTSTFTVPANASGTLTLRATAKMSADAGHTLPTPCNIPNDPLGYHGEMEDYLLVVDAGAQGSAPQATFSTSSVTLCTGTTMSVTNVSSGTPTPTYSWTANPSAGVTFSPSAATTSPTLKFSSAGKYTITCVASNSLGSNSTSKTVTVSACSSTGIDEQITGIQVRVFPNPASKTVYIETPADIESTIMIYNSLGQLLIKKESSGGIYALEVTPLEDDIYQIRVATKSGTASTSLIISR